MITEDQAADAIYLAKWFIATNKKRKHRAMRCGGFNEVVSQAMTTAVAYHNHNVYKLSTIVINSVKFALQRLEYLEGRRKLIRYEKANLSLVVKEQQCLSERVFREELQEAIKNALIKLSYRERVIITMRYFNGMTLDEVGHVMRICRERVRQIESKAIKNLQQPNIAALLVAFACDGGTCSTEGIDEAFEKRSAMTLKEWVAQHPAAS